MLNSGSPGKPAKVRARDGSNAPAQAQMGSLLAFIGGVSVDGAMSPNAIRSFLCRRTLTPKSPHRTSRTSCANDQGSPSLLFLTSKKRTGKWTSGEGGLTRALVGRSPQGVVEGFRGPIEPHDHSKEPGPPDYSP